jgi:hypothetical protein
MIHHDLLAHKTLRGIVIVCDGLFVMICDCFSNLNLPARFPRECLLGAFFDSNGISMCPTVLRYRRDV